LKFAPDPDADVFRRKILLQAEDTGTRGVLPGRPGWRLDEFAGIAKQRRVRLLS
jgi:hypothetical protein